jgi:hypothetical protein
VFYESRDYYLCPSNVQITDDLQCSDLGLSGLLPGFLTRIIPAVHIFPIAPGIRRTWQPSKAALS